MRIQEAIDLSIMSLCHEKYSWQGAVVLKTTSAQRLAVQYFRQLENITILNENGTVSKVALCVFPNYRDG